MWTQIVGFIMNNKSVKMGAGALGGSGIILLAMGVHADITNKIDKQDAMQKEYVQLVIEPIRIQIEGLQKDQTETKAMVRDIHNYLLKNK